jgi:hypothetical protein
MYAQEAAAQIYGNGFDALTALAEFKTVGHQFLSVGKTLRNLMGSRRIKDLSSEYLNYRYGWRPLIMDIQNLTDAILTYNEKRSRYSQRAGATTRTTHQRNFSASWGFFNVACSVYDDVTVSHRGSVCADIEVPKFQFNPLQTAWELVPLSFVVDWFVNIGRSISALTFRLNCSDYVASVGYKITIKREFEASMTTTKSGFGSGIGFRQTGNSDAILIKRQPTSVSFKPYPFINLDSYKILDMISLVIQRTL